MKTLRHNITKENLFKRKQLSAVIVSLLAPSMAFASPVYWQIGSGTPYWEYASNWTSPDWGSSHYLPSAGDDVIINTQGATNSIVRAWNGANFVVNSVNTNGGADTLVIESGGLMLNGAATADNATGLSTISHFKQNGGILNGAGNLTVTGNAALGGGTQSGSATTTLQGNSAITNLNLDAGRILRNEGVATWKSSGINLNAGNTGGAGRIDNAAGALWDAQGNDSLYASTYADLNNLPGYAVFNNAGTFRKSVATGTSYVSVAFNNTGTVDVQTGKLNMEAGSTHSGALKVASGAELNFNGGTHDLNEDTTMDVAGTLSVVSGTVNSNVGANIAGTTRLLGGTLNLNQNWQTANYTQGGGSLNGTGNLTVTGNATLSGGIQSGSATTTLRGNSAITNLNLDAGRILRNEGVATWKSSGINLNAGNTGGAGRIDNAAGAIWDAQGNDSLYASTYADLNNLPGYAVFNNAGTFRKSVATGTSYVSVAFNNTGTVDVQTGKLNMEAGSTHSGALKVGNGATVEFYNGNHDLNAGTSLDVAGTLSVASGTVNGNVGANIAGTTRLLGGTLNLNQDWQTANYTQGGGSLKGGGNLTVTGNAALGGGTQSGSATTTLRGNSAITNLNLDAGRIVRNEGVATWKSNSINLNASATGGAGRIDNAAGAVWDAQGNDSLYASTYADLNSLPGYAVFNNAGTFRKSVATGTSYVSVAFNNTGTVDVQAGKLNMDGAATANGFTNAGTITVASNAAFQTNMSSKIFANNGRLEGDGTIALAGSNDRMINSGVISAGSSDAVGSLAIDLGSGGTFQQLASGVLDFTLTSLSSFDTLSFQGLNSKVELGGTLRLTGLAGFNFGEGDFTLMTFNPGALTGAFDHIVALGFDPSWHFDVQYLNNSVVLHATTSAVPLPGAAWMMLSGLGLIGARRAAGRKSFLAA